MADRKEYQREYHQTHKEKRSAYRKQYYINNKETEGARNKQYAILHADKLSEYYQQYRDDHKKDIAEYSKEYAEQNKDVIAIRKAEYMRERKQIDPAFKLRAIISTKIATVLKLNESSKDGDSCLTYLPYSIGELRTHIEKQFESWMTWENHGRYDPLIWDDNDLSTWTWQLDHIIPQSDLPYTSMSDSNFKKCWGLDNLRPYSAKQNLLDGTTKIRHEKNNDQKK